MKVKNKIKVLLAKQEKRNKDLADYLGVVHNNVTNWTTNRHQPPLKIALRIALFFQLNVEDIFILNLENDQNND